MGRVFEQISCHCEADEEHRTVFPGKNGHRPVRIALYVILGDRCWDGLKELAVGEVADEVEVGVCVPHVIPFCGGDTMASANDSTQFNVFVCAALRGTGVAPDKAASYSQLCTEMYTYVQANPDVKRALTFGQTISDTNSVYSGLKNISTAVGYINRGNAVGVDTSGFVSYGESGGAAVLGVFVDRFNSYAQNQGIELNQCAISVAKVSLDIAAAGTGTVSSLTVFGAVLFGLALIATVNDSHSLAQACFAN